MICCNSSKPTERRSYTDAFHVCYDDHANNDIAVDWKEALVKGAFSGRCNDAGVG